VNAPARLAAYAAALAVVFAAGLGIGHAVGPEPDEAPPVHQGEHP
jgi:hypothetical protein